MRSLARRGMICCVCHAIAAVGLVLSAGGMSSAQQVMTQDQSRAELGKLFKAKPEERRILLEAQENRVALPPGLDQRVRAFLESSWSFEARLSRRTPVLGMLLLWNELAMQTTALDHTNPSPPGVAPPPYFGEQFGPPRTARAMAIVHIAMDEAVNTISPVNPSYQNLRATILNGLAAADKQQLQALQAGPAPALHAAIDRAIIESAYTSLAALYPAKTTLLDIARELSLGMLPGQNTPASLLGAKIGRLAAGAILNLRMGDRPQNSDLMTSGFPAGNPLRWHADPISQNMTALGGNYTQVVGPFLIASADAFRNKTLPGPPAPGSAKFITAYKQVKDLGAEPAGTTEDLS
jgi:hypothetical protein